jgi:hypothetical protein
VTGIAVEIPDTKCTPPDPSIALAAAKAHVETEVGLWDWIDDVEFLGLSWVEFK